jgi:hypothetical protein
MLAGQSRSAEVMRDWQAAFFKPAGDDLIRTLLSSMTPEQRAMLRQQNREAYDEAVKLVGWKDGV